MTEKQKFFWRATAIRCVRQFLATILGIFTGGMLITEVDWKVVLLSAFSSAFFIFLTCCYAGLPEVDIKQYIDESKEAVYYEDDDDEDLEEIEDENISEGNQE